jgi:hypothetical protein
VALRAAAFTQYAAFGLSASDGLDISFLLKAQTLVTAAQAVCYFHGWQHSHQLFSAIVATCYIFSDVFAFAAWAIMNRQSLLSTFDAEVAPRNCAVAFVN